MSHRIGRLVPVGPIRIGPDGTAMVHDFTPEPALLGGPPRFVMLHFTAMSIAPGAELVVQLGYGTDRFDAGSGAEAWTRPIDPTLGPIRIEYVGAGPGGVTLSEYGSGEPVIVGTPGEESGSRSNPDVFLHTDPYDEPVYETRGRCGATFDWESAACAPAGSPQAEAARTVCIIVMAKGLGYLSTCTGTLIQPDMVVTARHCIVATDGVEAASASVTFDFTTTCAVPGRRPDGYAARFHKVVEVVRLGDTDWALLRIALPPGGLGILPRPLRGGVLMPGETIHAIHHPLGGAKKMQAGTVGASGTTVDTIDVTGGSSGSALFDAMGRVVGAAASGGDPCVISWVSSRQVLDELAGAPAPDTPFDVMLVMDNSGSMALPGTTSPGATKMSEARDAASLFVQLVRAGAGDRLGMVSFSTRATLCTPLAPVDDAQKAALTGPAPFTGGSIGALEPDALTSIGHGIQVAMGAFTPSTNQRGLVLLTDGLQNTDPMVEAVEGMIGDARLFVVGFGEEWNLNGPLLSRVARDHGGFYTRAQDGLELMKFFTLTFGNIFEAGVLMDPERGLEQGQAAGEPVPFDVCEEDRITVVAGWDVPGQPVAVVLRTPGGVEITAATAGVESRRGPAWLFLRVPLPHGGERAGTWSWQVGRAAAPGDEFPPPLVPLRYFVNVVADGGPRLAPLPQPRRVYVGDPINPLVQLRYPDGSMVEGTVEVTVHAPDAALGGVVAQAGLGAPSLEGDPVDAFRATLQRLAGSGGVPVGTRTATFPLYDDGMNDDGAWEPDGVHGHPLADLTRFEGTYTFHARARLTAGCAATREAFWSVAVEPSIDAGQTEVVLLPGAAAGTGTLRFTPRDRYGSPLGPGRMDLFQVAPRPGTTADGPVHDRGDGGYEVPVRWDPAASGPGIVVSQPERAPVPIAPAQPPPARGCAAWVTAALAVLLLAAVLVIAWLLSR